MCALDLFRPDLLDVKGRRLINHIEPVAKEQVPARTPAADRRVRRIVVFVIMRRDVDGFALGDIALVFVVECAGIVLQVVEHMGVVFLVVDHH